MNEGELSHILGRAVAAVLIGWLVVYAVFRFGGDSPSSAAWVSLGVGATVGLVIYGIVLLLQRRRGGAALGGTPESDVASASVEQAETLRIVAGIFGGFAAIAAVMALASVAEWFSAESGDRAWTPAVLALWYLLAAGWSADQAMRTWRGDLEDLDSIPLVATLTAIVAALGYARGVLEAGQLVLIVAAIVAGGAAAVLSWRLTGARGVPLTAVGVVVVSGVAAALAFV
jgi:hypothetical protein